MSTKFSLKGAKGKLFHGAHSRSKLKILGTWKFSGPQSVDDNGGCPEWVADLMNFYPELKQVAINFEESGVVWSRFTVPSWNDEALLAKDCKVDFSWIPGKEPVVGDEI